MHNGQVMKGSESIQQIAGGNRRTRKLLPPSTILLLFSTLLAVLVVVVPVPFVLFSPGPTFDVLGSQGDDPILQITGVPEVTAGTSNGEDTGKLWMTTISERGGPGSTVTTVDTVRAWLTQGVSVYRYSDVYPSSLSADQAAQVTQAQMDSSHWTASVAALEYLGYQLPAVITIVGLSEGLGAMGLLEPGDILLSITTPDGRIHPMNSPSAPFALLNMIPVGTPLPVTVERDGTEKTVTVVTTADPAEAPSTTSTRATPTGSKLGVILDLDIDMPVDIDFHLDKVGGPSAGMIFALGIIDKMTDQDLTGGQQIAGTGAVTYEGTITPIGGITQKMFGAHENGIEWFLAPADNCGQVVGNVPQGLQVLAVSTLDEAVAAVEGIAAGNTGGTPTCEVVLDAANHP